MVDPATPEKFGKYYLLERIKIGGMAEVFKAKVLGVEGFEKLVAIKRVLPGIASEPAFTSMFIDEAKIAVELNHANIAQVFDLGKLDDTYYIALEYVHGKDLRTLWEHITDQSRRMPMPLAIYIVSRLCEGLDYAHSKVDARGQRLKIVHRDVSPQNVLISYEGEVKIVDFGIAKAAIRLSKTVTGVLKGKFGYMSPEQVRGLPVDHRSDIFAAGIILYELVTGKRLFATDNDFSTLERVRQTIVAPPREIAPETPEELETIIMKALAQDPYDRYGQAADMHLELQRFLVLHQLDVAREHLAGFMKHIYKADIERDAEIMTSLEVPAPPEDEATDEAQVAPAGDAADPEDLSTSPRLDKPEVDAGKDLPEPEDVSTSPGHEPSPLDFEDGEEDTTSETDIFALPTMQVASPLGSGKSSDDEGQVTLVETTLREESPLGKKRKRGRRLLIAALLGVLVAGAAVLVVVLLPPKPASLQVRVTPADAVITVDGVKDKSPVGDLEPGVHVLTVEAEKHLPHRQEIELAPGESREVEVTLESQPASLTLTVAPEETVVKLNGETMARKRPLKSEGLVPGETYTYTFEREGYVPQKREWVFGPGESRAEEISLVETTFKLDIKSTPVGARIVFKGEPVGRTPHVIEGLNPDEEYDIVIWNPGFRPVRKTIQHDGAPVQELDITMKPRPDEPHPEEDAPEEPAP